MEREGIPPQAVFPRGNHSNADANYLTRSQCVFPSKSLRWIGQTFLPYHFLFFDVFTQFPHDSPFPCFTLGDTPHQVPPSRSVCRFWGRRYPRGRSRVRRGGSRRPSHRASFLRRFRRRFCLGQSRWFGLPTKDDSDIDRNMMLSDCFVHHPHDLQRFVWKDDKRDAVKLSFPKQCLSINLSWRTITGMFAPRRHNLFIMEGLIKPGNIILKWVEYKDAISVKD